MKLYELAKKNGWLRTDEEAEELLKDKQYSLFARYGKDENWVMYQPYLPLLITEGERERKEGDKECS